MKKIVYCSLFFVLLLSFFINDSNANASTTTSVILSSNETSDTTKRLTGSSFSWKIDNKSNSYVKVSFFKNGNYHSSSTGTGDLSGSFSTSSKGEVSMRIYCLKNGANSTGCSVNGFLTVK